MILVLDEREDEETHNLCGKNIRTHGNLNGHTHVWTLYPSDSNKRVDQTV